MRAPRFVTGAIVPLAVRHLLRRKLVAGVAVLGLACGVGSVTATQLLHASVVASYEATTLRFAGRAVLQVTNGESGVAEELADELRGVRGVRAVVASVEGFVALPDLPSERLYLFGVDLLADQEVRDYGAGREAVVSDPLVFLAAPDSVALTAEFMRVHRLGLDDHVRVLAPQGVVDLTVRAALGRQEGPATVLDGRLAVVDLSVAQELLRLAGRVSALAIEAVPGADVAELERRVRVQVGSRGAVERPQARAATFARLLGNYRNGLFLAAAISMVVALYLVFNVATVAVAERRRELGLLRALGMDSRAIAGVVVLELLVLSSVAAGLGIPCGLGLAHLLASSFGAQVSALYADVGDVALALDASTVMWSATLAVATPLIALGGPLRRAAAIRPIEALRALGAGSQCPPRYRGSLLAGLVAILASGAVWVGRSRLSCTVETVGMTAILGVMGGVALAVPAGVQLVTRLAEQAAVWNGRLLPLLAARIVTRDLRRVALTCSAMLLSLAGTIAVATWIASLEGTLHAAFDTIFAGIDLVVSGGADPFAPNAVRIPESVAAEIAALPDVAFVDPIRVDKMTLDGSLAAIVASDAGLYRDGRRTLSMVDGDARAAAAELAAGNAIVVNQAFARRFGRRPGDIVELVTPAGALRVRIAGIHLELTPGDLGTMRLDRGLYRRWWHDDTTSLVEVALRPGGDRGRVMDAIRVRLGGRHRLVVLTIEEMRQHCRRMLERMTALVYPLLASATVCALVGVVGTGAAAMIGRTQMHGVLRAIGMRRSEISRLVALETTLVAGMAATLGVVVGSGLGWVQVEVLLRGMLGMSMLYLHPRAVAVLGGTAVVVATGFAGFLLGRSATRARLAAALRWE